MEKKRQSVYVRKPYHKRRVNVSNTLLWLLALAFLLIYAGGYTVRYLARGSVSTTEVTLGAVTRSVTFDGVVIRQETVYKADAAGVVSPTVAEGERARKGGEVCAIATDTLTEIEGEMARIDESILKQDEGGASLFEADIAATDAAIRKAAEDAAFGLAEGRVAELYQLRDAAARQLDARRQLLRVGARGDMKGLVSERAIFEARRSAARRPILADEGGIVSYGVDGYEAALCFERLDELGAEVARYYGEEGGLKRSADVHAGEPVCRVVTSNEWYIAGYIEAADATAERLAAWQEGKAVNAQALWSGGQAAITARVRSVREAGGGAVLVLRVDGGPDEFIDARGVRLTIDDDEARGLKIPNAAVAEKTLLSFPAEFVTLEKNQEYVTKRVNGKNERTVITVTQTSEDEGTAYVIQDYNNIRFGDELVSPRGEVWRITSAERIFGVYVANTGAATFRAVSFDGAALVGDLYTVLDPLYNTRLKPHDRIIVDAKRFDEKELVY